MVERELTPKNVFLFFKKKNSLESVLGPPQSCRAKLQFGSTVARQNNNFETTLSS